MLFSFNTPPRLLIALALALLFTLHGCSQPEDALRERATEWGELLTQLHALEREEAVGKIVDYLEPSAGREVRANEYYIEWTNDRKNPTLAFSVDAVQLNPQQNTGVVRITSVVQLKSGTKRTGSQETQWRLIDGEWYRIMIQAEYK